MRKIMIFLRDLLAVIVALLIAFCAGYLLGRNYNRENTVVASKEADGFDLRLPGEVEKNVVTVEEVESKLIEIGEFSTYSGIYEYTLGKEESRYWLEEVPVFGSTNSIEISCNGIVKVGYNISDIIVKVDDDKIYISIPEAQVFDNYVIWDSIECTESNNILNPIEFSQYEELIAEIEQKGLEDVISKGIYQSAEDNLKVLIEAFLAEFEDYEIVYM